MHSWWRALGQTFVHCDGRYNHIFVLCTCVVALTSCQVLVSSAGVTRDQDGGVWYAFFFVSVLFFFFFQWTCGAWLIPLPSPRLSLLDVLFSCYPGCWRDFIYIYWLELGKCRTPVPMLRKNALGAWCHCRAFAQFACVLGVCNNLGVACDWWHVLYISLARLVFWHDADTRCNTPELSCKAS